MDIYFPNDNYDSVLAPYALCFVLLIFTFPARCLFAPFGREEQAYPTTLYLLLLFGYKISAIEKKPTSSLKFGRRLFQQIPALTWDFPS